MSGMGNSMPPRRIRVQFGLGTMFLVVAAVALVLGWEVTFVRDRRACAARIRESFGGYALPYPESEALNGPDELPEWRDPRPTPSVPFWRQWLRDEPFGVISVPETWPEQEVRRVRALFPEAFVWWRRDAMKYWKTKAADPQPPAQPQTKPSAWRLPGVADCLCGR